MGFAQKKFLIRKRIKNFFRQHKNKKNFCRKRQKIFFIFMLALRKKILIRKRIKIFFRHGDIKNIFASENIFYIAMYFFFVRKRTKKKCLPRLIAI